MKKITFIFFAVMFLLFAGTIFAGGSQDSAENGVVTISMASGTVGHELDVLKEQIAVFESENSDIKVNLVPLPESATERHDLYVTWFVGQSSDVDILMEDIIWPPEFGAAGWLKPLNEYIEKYNMDTTDFFQGILDVNTVGGEVVSIPWFTDAGLMYYRKDLLEKYGYNPPVTYENLKNIAQDIMEKEGIKNGFVWQGASYEGLTCSALEFIWGHGGDFIKDGRVVINSPNTIAALNTMKDFIDSNVSPKGVISYQEEDARHLFQNGDSVFMRNWPYAWKLAQEEDSPVKGKIGAMANPTGPNGESSATLGGWNLGISNYSENSEAAFRFIMFLTGKEQQKYKSMNTGQNPTLKTLYSDPEILKVNPFYESLYDVFVGAKGRPGHVKYAELSNVFYTNVNSFLVGNINSEECVETIETECKTILSN